jgi:copper(I)-binding protein
MFKAMLLAAALIATPALVQAHEVKAGDLTLQHPHLRASMGQSPTTAGYLTIVNSGTVADRLVSVSCACASGVMVHSTQITGGMASMKALSGVDVPAGGTVVLAPGGMHLMVMGLKAPIKAGAMVDMTLTFAKAGKVKTPFMVMDNAPAPAMDGMADMPGMDHHQH